MSCSPSRFHGGRVNCSNTEGTVHAQVEAARGAEQEARAAAEEVEALRRTISQLPRPTMASRSETSITLSLARLAKTSGEDKVREVLSAASPLCDCSLLAGTSTHSCSAQTWKELRLPDSILPEPPVCLQVGLWMPAGRRVLGL